MRTISRDTQGMAESIDFGYTQIGWESNAVKAEGRGDSLMARINRLTVNEAIAVLAHLTGSAPEKLAVALDYAESGRVTEAEVSS